jgi:formylglycine-generating enzyme required for sulfatase activity
MVYIPPGPFVRGSTDADAANAKLACGASCDTKDETPQKTIELSGFFLDAKEVTVGQYNRCVDAGACGAPDIAGSFCSGDWAEYNNWSAEGPKAGRASHPINCINWKQAKTYCEWAGHEGGPRRLPTEAEWERAARGTQGEIYPWGNTPPGKGTPLYGNFADETAKKKFSDWTIAEGYTDGYLSTAPVGSFDAGKTEEGAYDMAGNVWEWVQDCYDGRYYNNAPSKDPKNDCDHNSASRRVIRGGGWDNRPVLLRAANRYGRTPEFAIVDLGVRCARSIE